MKLIVPDWPAPAHVVAFTTTRQAGVSQGNYASFNLATHVNDDSLAVATNRAMLLNQIPLPNEPGWLQQTHSTIAVNITSDYKSTEADAGYTQEANQPCAVLTADCLPLLVCNKQGTEVAAIHAGWRGLANGVIESTIHQLHSAPADLLVWLGPAIGPLVYEVDKTVYNTFVHANPAAAAAFCATDAEHWLVDLYALARQRLMQLGIYAIYGGDHCTYSETDLFYSFRRNNITGRMASVIFFR